nr:MAG TPA: hypothetical protein [Caudoviricetes sp.]
MAVFEIEIKKSFVLISILKGGDDCGEANSKTAAFL